MASDTADDVGVSRQTIVAIEKGNYSPSLELAFRISRLFKMNLEEVFTYMEDKKEPLGKDYPGKA